MNTLRIQIALPGLPFEGIEVVRRLDRPHVRLTNGRRHHAVGRYASIKMGATIPWESRLELHDLFRVEIDPAVIAYSVQPETLHWRSNRKLYRYTPDRLDSLAGGQKRIVEVKGDYDVEADPGYTEKLEQAAQIYSARGFIFELHAGSYIHNEPSFSAVEEVQAYRRAVVTTADIDAIRRRVGSGGVTLAEAFRLVPSQHPRATLFAMMTRRIVNIDLACGLHDAARVSPVGSQD